MKRLITLIIALSMILSFNFVAFADENQNEIKQQNQTIKTEIGTMKTDFLSNKAEIINLKNEIAAASSEVKLAIESFKEDDGQVSAEKIENLKQSIAILKSDKVKLREINSAQMSPLIEEFKAAMQNRDFKTAKSCLSEVIEIQETKITIFEQILSDTNNILEIINSDN